MSRGPKFYSSMAEFEREEIRPGFKMGWSLDDLYAEASFNPGDDDSIALEAEGPGGRGPGLRDSPFDSGRRLEILWRVGRELLQLHARVRRDPQNVGALGHEASDLEVCQIRAQDDGARQLR